jgi:hypothetical protein
MFRVLPRGVEFGASRNIIVRAATLADRPMRQPPPGCLRAVLYHQGFLVEDLPLGEYTTLSGRIRVVASVHDAVSAEPYFFVEALEGQEDESFAVLARTT